MMKYEKKVSPMCLYYIGETFFFHISPFIFVIECQIPVERNMWISQSHGRKHCHDGFNACKYLD